MVMRNDEYVIEIRRKDGRIYYTYQKVDGRWRQDVVRGKAHDVTAEQVLNHLLPVLSGLKPDAEIVVRYEPAEGDEEARS